MDDSSQSKHLKAAAAGINTFVLHYIKNGACMNYIYECDIQAELYNHIKDALMREDLLFAPGENMWKMCSTHHTEAKRVQLLHCEQKISGKTRNGNVDIAIWDPAYEKNKDLGYKVKRCSLLIEIKQKCKFEDSIDAVNADYDKLKGFALDHNQTAIAIAFSTKCTPNSHEPFRCVDTLKGEIEEGHIYKILVSKSDIYILASEKIN